MIEREVVRNHDRGMRRRSEDEAECISNGRRSLSHLTPLIAKRDKTEAQSALGGEVSTQPQNSNLAEHSQGERSRCERGYSSQWISTDHY